MKKFISLFLALLLVLMTFAGCAAKNSEGEAPATEPEAQTPGESVEPATPEEEITLKMWTWFPSADQYAPVIEAYEKDHPNVKIELTVMESQAYQQKLPVAFATDEEIDLCGVQLGAMVGQIESYLEPIDGLLGEVMPDWSEKYNPADVETIKAQTSDGSLKFLTMVKMGSMVAYYNVDLFNELGLEVPTTIDEYKVVVDTIREKRPDMMPVAYAGKDAWFHEEMMLTVLAQTNTYYNEWRYNDAPYNSPEMVKAFTDYKKFFDQGIFTKDVLDLDYAGAADKFLSGQAATYFQGTWDAGLLSESFRESLGATVGNVGAFAMPVVDPAGKPAIRAFIETGVGISKNSEHKKEAAEFLAYIVAGDGMKTLGSNFMGIPSKLDFTLDDSLLTTQEAKDGFALIMDLSANATSDRNNVSDFSNITGAGLQRVVSGQTTPEEEVANLAKEWESGKYGN